MKDLAAALALMTLNKESYLKNKALPHQEARDRVEVFQSPLSVNCCLHKLTAAVPAWRAPSKMNFFWSSCNMGSAPCSNPLYVQSQTSQVSTWCILEPKYRANLKGTTGTISELFGVQQEMFAIQVWEPEQNKYLPTSWHGTYTAIEKHKHTPTAVEPGEDLSEKGHSERAVIIVWDKVSEWGMNGIFKKRQQQEQTTSKITTFCRSKLSNVLPCTSLHSHNFIAALLHPLLKLC